MPQGRGLIALTLVLTALAAAGLAAGLVVALARLARGRRGSTGTFALSLAWTFLFPLPAAASSYLVYRLVVGSVRHQTWSVRLAEPASGAYQDVDVRAEGFSRAEPVPVEHIEVWLETAAGGSLQLRLERAPGGYLIGVPGRPRTDRGEPLDTEAILSWMREGGLDASGDAVRAEAAQILQQVRAQPVAHEGPLTVPGFGRATASVYATLKPPHWWLPTVFGFWALVWASGLAAIARR